jgi:uncharacterized protein (DUF58 family)
VNDYWQKSEEARAGSAGLLRSTVSRVPEVWLRFFLALGGLALAFLAALFSTVSRQAGEVLATVVLASSALVLATLVGLTTVPYLARRAAAARVRDAFNYEVTRVGILYVLVVLVIGVAALNTGNNLLYIIVAAMLAAIWISGFASAIVLRRIALTVDLPERVFAGQPFPARVVVYNHRRFLPSFSISVVANQRKKGRKYWRWTPETFTFPPGRPPEKQWLRLPDRKLRRLEAPQLSQPIFEDSIYVPYLPAAGKSSADVNLCFERRGHYQQHGFDVRTRFPFAFLTKSRRIRTGDEIIVLPSIELTSEALNFLPQIHGELESFGRGNGSSLYRIRDYMPEDSVRHVDWKATAKSGSLMVKEFAQEREHNLRIIFDNPGERILSAGQYERAVQLTAALSWHFAAENRNIAFAAQGDRDSSNIFDFLEFLALVQPGSGASIFEGLPVSEDFNLILTANPDAVPAGVLSSSHIVDLSQI